MSNIKHRMSVWLQLVTFIGLWIAILYVSGTPLVINPEALKKLPHVVSGYVVLHFIFTRWAWRWRVFQGWLVPYPDLQGTWRGELQTTWQDSATGAMPGPISVTVAIRQTFSTVSVVMFTKESMSYSMAASFSEADDSGLSRLTGIYSNSPKASVRQRSVKHDGAVVLRIVTGRKRMLEGEYWTNRKSTGDLRLGYSSATLAEQHEE